MSTTWTSDSFAKINLGLNVLHRNENGYHDIETGFCFLEWRDTIRMTASEKPELVIEGNDEIPSDSSNLIMKAYYLLREFYGLKGSYRFKVIKRIPAGAGLGGGSSNAAMALKMLRKAEKLDISDEELLDIGAQLGADIPLFIKGKTAIGTGTGTELKPAQIQPDRWIVTVYPNFESSTPLAYANCTPNDDRLYSIEKILTDIPVDEWEYELVNDLEQGVFQLHPTVGNFRDQMKEFGAEYAAMSGSGSSVFGLFEQDFVALSAYKNFIDLGYQANLTKPLFQPDFGVYILD